MKKYSDSIASIIQFQRQEVGLWLNSEANFKHMTAYYRLHSINCPSNLLFEIWILMFSLVDAFSDKNLN